MARFRFARLQEVNEITTESWPSFRRYLLIAGPSIVVGSMLGLARHAGAGGAVVLAAMVAYYAIVCRVLAARST